ncbi:hypothetical protein K440DRAFT_636109 [Wilcoxina mikolae CBS 423.85]|nr:hypothetical protein K440DRAFT_636109 [Wilcoxina mikolae CBS 423.85]
MSSASNQTGSSIMYLSLSPPLKLSKDTTDENSPSSSSPWIYARNAMDPLSVCASIAGLLTLSGNLITLLSDFKSTVRDAPRLAAHVLGEIEALRERFIHLQNFIENPPDTSDRLEVGNLIVTLSACVLIFSELGRSVEGCRLEQKLDLWDRRKLVGRETEIRKILGELVQSKTSLNLMLSVIQWLGTDVPNF